MERKRIQHIKNELITQKMSSTHKNQNFKRNHLKKNFLCGEFLKTKGSPLTSHFLCGLFYFYVIFNRVPPYNFKKKKFLSKLFINKNYYFFNLKYLILYLNFFICI
jgi:hypothetical protein